MTVASTFADGLRIPQIGGSSMSEQEQIWRVLTQPESLTNLQKYALMLELTNGGAMRVNLCKCGDPVPGLVNPYGDPQLGHFRPWGENPDDDLRVVTDLLLGRTPQTIVVDADALNRVMGARA